jgi:hypothetical protein
LTTGYLSAKLRAGVSRHNFSVCVNWSVEDIHGNTGKWPMNVGGAALGVPQTLVTATTPAEPSHGMGDWQNLDLSQIRGWQILGDFGAPGPFDLNFDRLMVYPPCS